MNRILSPAIPKRQDLMRYILLLLLLLFASRVFAQKMQLSPSSEHLKIRKHPHTELLRQAIAPQQRSAQKADYQKLLVILVDFQEEIEDDPLTTGNGKFLLEPDPDYVYSIGAPPHDREYFEANLEAMRYYYLAVSAGSYDLEYDVWPKDKPAYTLQHHMSYYNPPNAPSDVFVQKMEEYFKEAFETADRDDPQIDFGSYEHYMIIHAGSDWQHDVFGNSPSDLPSFFIRVGEGKQAIVDEGQTEIFHACNVPATISQDFEIVYQDGLTIHSGYGALNAVLFHEFGHSLGLVDLYNTRNFYPMVGAFDIMDSGGSGVLVDELDNGDLVYVQGILPSLPGAFSRALLFESDFRSRGLMKDITEFAPNTAIEIAASSHRQSTSIKPSIIKFPINDHEYFLIENRSVDPDGDGFTAVYGALDGRVVMYPTPSSDPTNTPSYEYDYLLPSFMRADGSVEGGGLLIWHVDEKQIFEEGSFLSDGSFRSNFDNNTVNTNFNRPGVSVLEADGLRDLGEPYSMYWTGTAYEYFHGYKPILDTDGLFVNWSFQDWRPTLSAHTKPAMLARNGIGSLYYMDDISSPDAVMSFTLRAGFFEEVFSAQHSSALRPAPPVNTDFSEISLPFYDPSGMTLYSYMNDEWQDLMGSSDLEEAAFDFPLVAVDNNGDGYRELVGVKGSSLYFMDFANIDINTLSISFADSIFSPMPLGNDLYVHSRTALYHLQDHQVRASCGFASIRTIAGDDDLFLVLEDNDLYVLDRGNLEVIDHVSVPESIGDYEPIIINDHARTMYFFADSGNLYRYQNYELRKIFTNDSAFLPTQMGAFFYDDTGVRIFFALGDRAYILGHNGHIKRGFPRYLNSLEAMPHMHPRSILISPHQRVIFFPVESQGFVALWESGEPAQEYSLLFNAEKSSDGKSFNDYLCFDEANSQLLWYNSQHSASGSSVYIHSLGFDENPILWSGARNGAGGSVIVPEDLGESTPSPSRINAYVYPNPVKSGVFRLRIERAFSPIDVYIYDVSGKKVFERKNLQNGLIEDIELDSAKFSTGVYIAYIKNWHAKKTIKFAIEK